MELIWTLDFFHRVRVPAFTAWLASQIFNLRSNWALHKWNTVWLNFKRSLYLKKVVLHPFRYIADVMVIPAMEFQVQGYKIIESVLPNNQHTQRQSLLWGVKKVPKFDFQSQFSKSKIIRIFLYFFFIEEYQFRRTLYVIDSF